MAQRSLVSKVVKELDERFLELLPWGLLVAQFAWWNAKAPQVLKLGKGYK